MCRLGGSGIGCTVPGELVAGHGCGVALQRGVLLKEGGDSAVAVDNDINGIVGEAVAPAGEVVAVGWCGNQGVGGAVSISAAAAHRAPRRRVGASGDSIFLTLKGDGLQTTHRHIDVVVGAERVSIIDHTDFILAVKSALGVVIAVSVDEVQPFAIEEEGGGHGFADRSGPWIGPAEVNTCGGDNSRNRAEPFKVFARDIEPLAFRPITRTRSINAGYL